VTAAVFDVGNVLYGWDPHSFLARQIPEDEARLRFIDDIGLWEWHDTLDGGRAYRESADELSGKFPQYAEHIAAWGTDSARRFTDPVRALRLGGAADARGVPLFATPTSRPLLTPFHAREQAFLWRFRNIVGVWRRDDAQTAWPSITSPWTASAEAGRGACSSTTADQ
jgi:hypothetical protein